MEASSSSMNKEERLVDGNKKTNELLILSPCSSSKPELLGEFFEVNDIDEYEVDVDEDEEDEDEEDGGHENNHNEDLFPSRPLQNSISQRGPCKRELISCEDDIQYHRPNEQNKRMRNHRGSTMDMYMEQLTTVQHNIKSLYDEKEKEVQEKNKVIYNCEHELLLMAELVKGYRKALRDTRQAFNEYRQRHPEPLEPLYVDVPGSGGLVVSVMAFEKMRLEQEEKDNMKRLIVTMIDEFERGWIEKLDVSLKKVHEIDGRLFKVSEDVKLLKELAMERSVSKPESEATIFKEEEKKGRRE